MNWNNGQLARHSRRGYNNDATRQQQYFAQAKRQKVTESRKRKYSAVDFVPSYLEDLPEKSDRPSHDASRHREPRRRILTLQNLPRTIPQATRPSKDDRRIENASISPNITGKNDASIDAKRRKLLQQSDWSGVELQKPVIIRYPETARSARKVQRHIYHDRLDSPTAKISKNHISTDTVIKIANQEYRWSPGNNSIRTWQLEGQNALPETPMVKPRSLYDISSSASKSFSSFVPESPCAERALQIGRAKACREQPQSVSHTSPSIFDEPLAKTARATQYFHPQPIRRMPQSIYARLSDSAKNGNAAFYHARASPAQLQSDASSCVAATESRSGESVVPETVNEDNSSKISESPQDAGKSIILSRLSLLERSLEPVQSRRPWPQSTEAVHSGEVSKCSESLPSSITTPDVYRIAEASHTGNRLSTLPYKRPAPAAPDLGDEDEIMWKRFVLGPGRPVLESAGQCGANTLDDKGSDSRSKLGVNTAGAEAPTRSASGLENASPVPDTPQRPRPTAAPAGPTPPLTISADGPDASTNASLSSKPQTTSDEAAPVYSREQRDKFEAMTAFPTAATDASQPPLRDAHHMTSKLESTFHPPSLFVGRLVASAAVTSTAVAAPAAPTPSEPDQSSSVPAPKAASARVMSRRRRNKRREAGRPDIRALPNIQGHPIEFTP